MSAISLDLTKISDCVVEGVVAWDAPDYSDAYIASAVITEHIPASHEASGTQVRDLTEPELDWLNEQRGFVFDQVEKQRH